jgi:hypothetical protein
MLTAAGLLSFGPAIASMQKKTVAGRPVVLSFDPIANSAFQAKAKKALGAAQTKLGKKLCLRIIMDDEAQQPTSNCFSPSSEETAVVQMYLARNGDVYRHFSTHAGAFDRPTSMGSISKTLGVIALAESGASPEETWCSKKFFKVHNADGFAGHADCTAPGAQTPATERLARSDTLALLNRLRQLDEEWLRSRFLNAGISNTPLDYHPGIAAATGVLNLTPRQILELFHTIAAGSTRRITFVRGSPLPSSEVAQWARAVMAAPGPASYVRTLMATPVTNLHGTAHHLLPLLPLHAAVFAKTGTSQGDTQNVTGKFLAFSVATDNTIWTALVAVQVPRPDQTLGMGLQGSDFAPLHSLLAAEISAFSDPAIASGTT